MKKLLLSMALLTIFGLWTNAQTIENFESLTMNIFSAGTNGMISVIANPDTAGNQSLYVGKMVRGWDGDPWAGWYATMETPVNVTANKYVHLKLWKPRISPVVFKYEGTVNSGDVYPITPQATTNEWEELVFDMSVVSGDYVKIVLIPDFESPVTLTEDIVIYYDDIYANDDPTVGSAPVQVMENFETIPLNYMLNGVDDNSYMELIPNPDISGVNLSPYVIHFFRDKDGYPWDGFWSNLPTVIDVTDNKYVHVKVWKPRISPVKFKIEGGAAGTIEVESMYAQTMTDAWEDMVFDFSEKTGTYPIIAFLPDFMDPVGLTEDIDIYFDDIILNNDPNPIMPPAQTISVDMTESGMTAGEQVWISGALGGIYGTWSEPGTNLNNEMLDTDADGIYSITLSLPESLIAFKFFWGTGWTNGDPAPGGDRTLQLENTMNVLYKWGVDGIVPLGPDVTFNVDMTNADPFNPATDDVYISGDFAGWAQPGSNADYMMTPSGNPMIYTLTVTLATTGTIAYKYFRVIDDVASWDNGEWTGDPNRKAVITGTTTLDNIWADKPVNVTFNVDMTNADPFDPATDDVYIAGSLANGWAQPGTISEYKMNPTVENDMIYTITLLLYEGDYQYKYFRVINGVASWDNGEWTGEPNRVVTVDTIMTIDNIWGTVGINEYAQVTFKFYPNPVNDQLTIDNLEGANKIEIFNITGEKLQTLENISTNSVAIKTANLPKGMYMLVVYHKNEVQATKFIK